MSQIDEEKEKELLKVLTKVRTVFELCRVGLHIHNGLLWGPAS
jgi:hypothetical protein